MAAWWEGARNLRARSEGARSLDSARPARSYPFASRFSILRGVLPRSAIGRLSRRELSLLFACLGAVVALYIWGAHHWLDLIDEGYFAYTSSRILVGELPYRDFATPYTP